MKQYLWRRSRIDETILCDWWKKSWLCSENVYYRPLI